MLKNNKLLYILPEMAFTADVGETPKQDYYFVSSFHQINGEFMKDENFVFENLRKLFERIEEETYSLILPDFLFTDTIVNVPETDDVKIAEHLRDHLLPRIDVSTFSHETRTSVLLQRKTTAKVQLSAFEKEMAASIKLAIGGRKINIEEVVPLSWTLKAAVSLEPSLTVTQLGERLYLAEHYVGINQTVNAPLTDLDIIAETVKTLKGSDPNLQTAYLFTSVLVEEKLKGFLTKTLPVQQLTEPTGDDAKIPSYVKQVVEVGARTLSLKEFVVPRFSLEIEMNNDERASAVFGPEEPETTKTDSQPNEQTSTPAVAEEKPVEEKPAEETPGEQASVEEKPVAAGEPVETAQTEAITSEEQPAADSEKVESKPEEKPAEEAEKPVAEKAPDQPAEAPAATGGPMVAAAVFLPTKKEPLDQAISTEVKSSSPAEYKHEEKVIEEKEVAEETHVETAPLAQEEKSLLPDRPELSFMKKDTGDEAGEIAADIAAKSEAKGDKISKDDKKKLVSKKKGGMGSFFKKLFLFLLIFVVTIALGIAVGLGILYLTGKNVFQSESEPTPEPTFLPTPEPTPPPQPESSDSADASASATTGEEVDKAAMSVLVVNATGVAGLAGQTKTALERDGFANVQTGNAKGEYTDAGTFVLMAEKDSNLIAALEQAAGATLTYDEDYEVEDSAGTYDAVIVLNEE